MPAMTLRLMACERDEPPRRGAQRTTRRSWFWIVGRAYSPAAEGKLPRAGIVAPVPAPRNHAGVGHGSAPPAILPLRGACQPHPPHPHARTARPFRPPAAQPAPVGERPLQSPLPVLHAGGALRLAATAARAVVRGAVPA